MRDSITPCDEFIERMENILPDICETNDLIHVGIFKSVQSAKYARDLGDCPEYFQLVRRIIYPKKAVIKWLKDKKHENLEKKNVKKRNTKSKSIHQQTKVGEYCWS